MFGPVRDEVAGGWRGGRFIICTLQQIKSRRMRSTVHVARMGEMRNAYERLVGIPRRRWEVVWEGIAWIDLA